MGIVVARWKTERLERSARRARAILGIVVVLLLVGAGGAILLGNAPTSCASARRTANTMSVPLGGSAASPIRYGSLSPCRRQ
jgi:hypothetical protein